MTIGPLGAPTRPGAKPPYNVTQPSYTVWELSSDHVPSMTHPAELTEMLERAPAAAATR